MAYIFTKSSILADGASVTKRDKSTEVKENEIAEDEIVFCRESSESTTFALRNPITFHIFFSRSGLSRDDITVMPVLIADPDMRLSGVELERNMGKSIEMGRVILDELGDIPGVRLLSPRRLGNYISLKYTHLEVKFEEFDSADERLLSLGHLGASILFEFLHKDLGSIGSYQLEARFSDYISRLESLPIELLPEICWTLNPLEFVRFFSINRRLNSILKTMFNFKDDPTAFLLDSYWRSRYLRDFEITDASVVDRKEPWCQFYRTRNSQAPLKPIHFRMLEFLGSGTTSNTLRAERKLNNQSFALKRLFKSDIVTGRVPLYLVQSEKEALLRCNHPNIIRMHAGFQDPAFLYMVLDYAEHGDLFSVLEKHKGFPINVVQFLAAEIASGLDYLHNTAFLIHRDLKSENILVFSDGHIALSDFGTCTLGTKETFRLPTKADKFVGTPEFMPPEHISIRKVCYASDLWSFGVLLFQLIQFKLPFRGASEFLTMKNVCDYVEGSLPFTDLFTVEAKSLINSLLRMDPTLRLGFADYREVKLHEFFKGINWPNLVGLRSPLADQQLDLAFRAGRTRQQYKNN